MRLEEYLQAAYIELGQTHGHVTHPFCMSFNTEASLHSIQNEQKTNSISMSSKHYYTPLNFDVCTYTPVSYIENSAIATERKKGYNDIIYYILLINL